MDDPLQPNTRLLMLLAITNGVIRINILVINGEFKLAQCRLQTLPLRDGLIIYIVLSQT